MGVLRELFISIKLRNDTRAGHAGIVKDAQKAGGEVEQAWEKTADRATGTMDRFQRKLSKKLDPATFLAGAIGGFVGGLTYGVFNSIINTITSIPDKIISAFTALASKSKAINDMFVDADGKATKLGKSIENLEKAFIPVVDAALPFLRAMQSLIDGLLPKYERLGGTIRGMIDYFTGGDKLNGVVSGILGLVDHAWPIAEKYLHTLFNWWVTLGYIIGALSGVAGGINGLFDAFSKFADLIVRASEVVMVFAAIVTDTVHPIGERFEDLAKFILGKIIDLVQLAIPVWAEFCYNLLDMSFKAAEGIANAFIDGMNGAIDGIMKGINNVIRMIKSIPLVGEALKGVGDLNVGAIGHVDFSGMAEQLRGSSIFSTDEIVKMLEDMQQKYGLNVSLEDLAKKYNVDLSAFNKLNLNWSKDLKETIKDLKDKIDEKDMKSQVTVYLHQAFTDDVDQAGAKAAGREATDALVAELKRQGFGS